VLLERLEADALPARSGALGARALARLEAEVRPLPGVVDVRGRGLLLGIELASSRLAAEVMRDGLRAGWILLAEGADARVLALSPPLVIAEPLLDGAIDWLVGRLSS
jgi:acetylornithine aminotransferase